MSIEQIDKYIYQSCTIIKYRGKILQSREYEHIFLHALQPNRIDICTYSPILIFINLECIHYFNS